MGKTINDIDTYMDDYGNEKNLTVVDHTPKTKVFGYNPKPKTKAEREIERQGVIATRELSLMAITQDQFPKLIKEYAHAIDYDTDKEMYMWNNDKTKIIIDDDLCYNYFLEQLKRIKNVSDK
jgi:hypothetical protein